MSRTLEYIEELIGKRRSVWVTTAIIALVCLPSGAYKMWKPMAITMGYSHGHSLNPTPVSKEGDFWMGFFTFTLGLGVLGFAYWYHRKIGKEILIEGRYLMDHEDT